MVAAYVGRGLFNLGEEVRYEDVIMAIDWDRVLLQAYAEHERVHLFNAKTSRPTCGLCIQNVLLRKEEPMSESRCVHYASRAEIYETTVDEPNLNRKSFDCKDCIGETISLMSRYGRLKVEIMATRKD